MSQNLYNEDLFHNYSLDKRAIPMALVNTLVAELADIPVETQLFGTGIAVQDLHNTKLRVSYRQRIRQLQNMLQLVNDRGYWLSKPREISISEYGLLGYAMMSSATLEQAIQIAVKYHRMAGAIFELAFSVDADQAILRVENLLPTGDVAEYVVEELFKGIAPLISLLIGTTHKPSSIHLSYRKPAVANLFEEAFQCEVQFEQPWCEYRFPAQLLNQPLAEADSNTARICEESCRKLLDQMEIEEDIVSKVCHLLLSTPGEFPKLDVVAERLSMGARTLRRRLFDLGTSYQRVLDDVRKELAMEYLQTTNLTAQEISDLLGYSEVTNFRRAFLKWSSISPYQFRKQVTSPDNSRRDRF